MIIRTPASQKNNLSFDYDAMGRRTAKHVLTSDNTLLSSTYYILDAQGNNMATYQMDMDTANSSLSYHLGERYIYGSSRLGMLKEKVNVLGSAFIDTPMDSVTHTIGNKRYEFNNHLGNVLSVISDKPVAHDNGGTVDYWMADIRSSYDYSPFGVMLSGRTFENSQTICEDSTVNGASGTVLQEGFGSWSAWSPNTSGGPIGIGGTELTYLSDEMQVKAGKTANIGAHKTFITGSGLHSVNFDITGNTCQTQISFPPMSSPKPINVYIKDSVTNTIIASASYTTAGSYSISFTPASAGMTYKIEFYMSSARFCQFSVDNILITYQESSTTTVCKNVDNSYRYGFNGQERVDEVSGKGNSYTAEFWQYDSRLGRRWNVDPVFKEYESPYATFANNPIWFVDRNGRDTSFCDNEARETFLKGYNKSKDLLKQVSTEHNDVNQKIRELEYKGKNTKLSKDEKGALKDLKNRGSELKDRLENLHTIVNDFKLILREDTPIYEYSSSKEAFDQEEKLQGKKLNGFVSTVVTERETSGGVKKQVIHVYVRAHQDATNIHENRHGVQLVKGDFDNILDMEYDAYKVEGAYDPDGIEQFRQNAYQIYKANINPTLVMPYESFNLRRAVQQVVEGNHFH